MVRCDRCYNIRPGRLLLCVVGCCAFPCRYKWCTLGFKNAKGGILRLCCCLCCKTLALLVACGSVAICGCQVILLCVIVLLVLCSLKPQLASYYLEYSGLDEGAQLVEEVVGNFSIMLEGFR